MYIRRGDWNRTSVVAVPNRVPEPLGYTPLSDVRNQPRIRLCIASLVGGAEGTGQNQRI